MREKKLQIKSNCLEIFNFHYIFSLQRMRWSDAANCVWQTLQWEKRGQKQMEKKNTVLKWKKKHGIMWLNWCEKGMKYSNMIRFQTLNTPSITLKRVRMMFHWDDLFEIRFVFVSFYQCMKYRIHAVHSLKASNIMYVHWTPNIHEWMNEWTNDDMDCMCSRNVIKRGFCALYNKLIEEDFM